MSDAIHAFVRLCAALSVACIVHPPAAPSAIALVSPPSASDAPPPATAAPVPAPRLPHRRNRDFARRTWGTPERGHPALVSFVLSDADRWQGALDGYISPIVPGRGGALHDTQVPFATYLNEMHVRIHALFAEAFLYSLDALPATDRINDESLVTRLEIVLARDGHLKQIGVLRSSGVQAFDIGALDSVDRAQPFDPAPDAIVSADGSVYVRWEFHRNEVFACSTMGVRPFLLSAGDLMAPQP
jgi:TonB family protein